MLRQQFKITGLIVLFLLLNQGLRSQGVKISTNLPESLNAGQSVDVDVNIDKGGVASFAKFQMDLPFGFTAQPLEIKGGNWTFDQQRAKIVWVSIPGDQQFVVRIKLTVPDNALNTCVITGKFFYLENNVKKEYEMPPHNLKISSGVAGTNPVTTNTVSTTTTNTVATSNPVTTNTVSTSTTNTVSTSTTNTVSTATTSTVATTNTVSTSNPVTTNTVTSNPSITNANNSGVVYRVQIGAFSIKPSKGKFPGVKEFWIYEDNGLFKATAGKFNSLNEAEAYKAQLRSQGMDGFVVAFQNGVRIKLR